MPAVQRQPFADDESRWQALVRRDRDADGVFVYSVRTTGVFCRPSCSARRARRENVSFFASCEQAVRAGFRPCKRCRPTEASRDDRQRAAVTRACRLMDDAVEAPKLAALAKSVGMSPFHFHRVFKMTTGVTPKAYAAARRMRRVEAELQQGATVTEALYGGGFNSSGRFYAASTERLGMTPTTFRAGGAGVTMRFATGPCSLGLILIAATDKGVCAIFLGEKHETLARELRKRFPKATIEEGGKPFDAWLGRAIDLVENPALGVDLPLDVRGTTFQLRVWEALRQIPLGATANYTEIAQRIGQPTAARAVAQACGANPVAIAIPCHRVIRTDESLSGYRWGVERKAELLKRERAEE